MLVLRIYLLSGLLVHKVLWELLKRPQNLTRPPDNIPQSYFVKLVKILKIAILLGIIVQTMAPEVLPITSEPSAIRVIGVTIFTLGLLIAISSRIQLGNNWSDIETGHVREAQNVVSKGIYRYIRHPIYVGDLLLLIGLELSLNSWLVIGAALIVPIVLWKAIQEEKTLISELPAYSVYCTHTKRFIPFIV